MDVCTVIDNVITNIIVIPDGSDPANFGARELPYGKWIGDLYDSDAAVEKRIAELPGQIGDESGVWDAMAAAYQEGVNQA